MISLGQTCYILSLNATTECFLGSYILAIANLYTDTKRNHYSLDAERASKPHEVTDAEPTKQQKERAQKGDVKAACALGDFYAKAEPPRLTEAVEWYQKAANHGYAPAQSSLGVMYQTGDGGLTQSDQQALKWYRLAARQGNAKGQWHLAEMYACGIGIEPNINEAKRLYKLAAAQGLPEAASALGQFYFADQKFQEALKWYKRGADLGDNFSQFKVAEIYFNGKDLGGVREDRKLAVRWYEVAAKNGYPLAMTMMGHCYENGYGVATDESRAVAWYQRAIKAGDTTAEKLLKDLQDRPQVETSSAQPIAVDNDSLYKVGDTVELINSNNAPIPLAMSLHAINEFQDICKPSHKSVAVKQASRMVALGQLVMVPCHTRAE